MKKIAVLIVAAGKGRRFGNELPKQYNVLGDKPVLTHCIARFLAHPEISIIKTVISKDDIDLYKQATKQIDILPPVYGGKTRQDSVRLGLESLKEENPDYVLIHDGARPFVDISLINEVLYSLKNNIAVIPAIEVVDTLKRADENKIITNTVDRKNLYRAQTPQGFDFDTILKAHESAKGLDLTDDAGIIENYGQKVFLCKGNEENIKITTKNDLEKSLEKLENHKKTLKIGFGFDVHQLIDGNELCLCGIKIKHDKKLKGHSDADVGLHAITDALLGAINAGDIGSFFPPNDNKWKDASSDLFLRFAYKLLKLQNGEINNIDLTIMCEKPKINQYRLEMIRKVAEILDISQNKISIKATTTEKLGFTGRQEGIATQAVASISI